jgi:hypothetical protein
VGTCRRTGWSYRNLFPQNDFELPQDEFLDIIRRVNHLFYQGVPPDSSSRFVTGLCHLLFGLQLVWFGVVIDIIFFAKGPPPDASEVDKLFLSLIAPGILIWIPIIWYYFYYDHGKWAPEFRKKREEFFASLETDRYSVSFKPLIQQYVRDNNVGVVEELVLDRRRRGHRETLQNSAIVFAWTIQL